MYRRLVVLALLMASFVVAGSVLARPHGIDVLVKFRAVECPATLLPGAVLNITHVDKFDVELATYEVTANGFGRVDVVIEDTVVNDKILVTITPDGGSTSGVHTYTYRYDEEQLKEDYVASIPRPLGECYDTRSGDIILIKYGAFHEE